MTDRFKQALRALPALSLIAAALTAPAAVAAPAAVKLRVEGAGKTLFEDRITSDGHTVTTAAGGTHKCDGTNGGGKPHARPTPPDPPRHGGHLRGVPPGGRPPKPLRP